MTVIRGLREALALVVVAAVAAVLGSLIWRAVWGGGFVEHLGLILLIGGALLGLTGDLTLSRIGTMQARTIFGLPPERETGGGGRVLTGVGIFLFVGLPLMAAGLFLAA